MRDPMIDSDAFEARLRAALQRYAATTPDAFDALAFAHAVALAEPRGRWRWPLGSVTAPVRRELARVTMVVVLVGLVLALVAAVIAGGSQRRAAWQLLDIPDGGALVDVAAGPSGLVAIGPSLAAHGEWQAWHSSDGVTWTTASVVGGSAWPQSVRAVAGWSGGFVAVGGTVALSSHDGIEWTWLPPSAVQIAPLAYAAGDGITDATAFADTLVAVGGLRDPASDSGEPAIWTSTDGQAWHLVTPLDGAQPGFFGALWAVTRGGPGLVAVGEVDDGWPVWVSSDGSTWRRAPSSDWPSAVRLRFVAAGRDGTLVACGSSAAYGSPFSGVSDWRALTSRDGLVWATVKPAWASAVADVVDGCMGVAAMVDGFVAATTTMNVNAAAAAGGYHGAVGVLWTSPDGGTWQQSMATDPADTYFGVSAVHSAPGGLYLSGSRQTDLSGYPTAEITWYLPAGRLADVAGGLPKAAPEAAP